ncbi:PAS domain S-box protein, partial [bacterium]|nr:PAS domain S-box protein [bacterium]
MTYDDTKRKRAEQAELESRKRYKKLLEMLPEAIFETDKNFNLTYVNKRAFDLFGYSNEDMAKGINGLNIIAPPDRDKAKEYLAMRAQGVEHGVVEYQAIKKDGSTFPVLVHVNSIIKDGKMAGILGIIVDISERKKTELELLENEKKYRILFESANDGILILKDNKIVECNSKGLSIFGFENKKEIIGMTPSELSPERQPDGRFTNTHEKENLIKASKGVPQRFNWRHYRKGGKLFDAEISLNTILLEDKIHVQAIIRDITEQVQAELKLQESEAKFKRLFEDLGDAVYVTLLGGKSIGQILEANPAAVRQSGYSRSELLEMNILKDLYIPGTGKLNSEEWEGKINAGELITSVEKKRRKDGTSYWTEVLITPIFFKGQKACLSINRDITERIKTEQDLKKALLKAEESDRLKSAFLTSMSHEIRTPLNAIIGFSNIIADSVKDPQLSKFSLLINKQNDLLLKLVNDILEFATIESESVSINYEVFDLNNLI